MAVTRRSGSWICVFCSREFSRSDVLGLHHRRCPQRGDQPVPDRLRPGQPRKACDACARDKLWCDFDQPCETCLSRGRECTFERISSPTTERREPLLRPSLTKERLLRDITLTFFPKYVDSRPSSLPAVFGYNDESVVSVAVEVPDPIDSLDSWLGFGDDVELQSTTLSSASSSTSDDQLWSQSSLPPEIAALNGLIDDLTAICVSLPSGSAQSRDYDCLSLLTISNIPKFFRLYVQHWHVHSPIIHHTLLQVNQLAPELLLAVLTMGAHFSDDANDTGYASQLTKLAEIFIFRDKAFNDNEPCDSHLGLQLLQAGLSICQLQLRIGDEAKQEQIRNVRFDRLIDLVKRIDLQNTRNPFYSRVERTSETFNWAEFVYSEMQLRTFYGVFNIENGFTTFNKQRPRITIDEVGADMPCSSATYLADNEQECFELAIAEAADKPIGFGVVLNRMMEANDLDDSLSVHMRSVLNMFILILALLQSYDPLQGQQTTSRSFQSALNKWWQAWQLYCVPVLDTNDRLHGFQKVAAIELFSVATSLVLVNKRQNQKDAAADQENLRSALDLLKQLDINGGSKETFAGASAS